MWKLYNNLCCWQRYCTGWSSWIILRNLKYFILSISSLTSKSYKQPWNSILNTSISGVKSSWTFVYITQLKVEDYRLRELAPAARGSQDPLSRNLLAELCWRKVSKNGPYNCCVLPHPVVPMFRSPSPFKKARSFIWGIEFTAIFHRSLILFPVAVSRKIMSSESWVRGELARRRGRRPQQTRQLDRVSIFSKEPHNRAHF